ncbi:MAG: YdcF family protein [Myxococcota bacterium]
MLAVAGALLAPPVLTAILVHRFGRTAPRPPATPRVAVVLGARVYPDGTPSPALVDRVKRGAWLVQSGHATRLVLSGGSPDARRTEARVMASLARQLGLTDEQLVLEEQSRSTFENAARCATILADAGVREVLLVTCDFHLARATAHFRAHRLTVWPVASLRALTAADRLMATARETAALLARPRLLLALAGMLPPRR